MAFCNKIATPFSHDSHLRTLRMGLRQSDRLHFILLNFKSHLISTKMACFWWYFSCTSVLDFASCYTSYLKLLMAFCANFQALVQMKNWFMRFPTILQPCECIIEMLRGQYAHSVGCYNEASFHYIEAVKVYIGYVYNIDVML